MKINKRFQRRALGVSELQCREVDGKPSQIYGYAVVFDSPAYGEVIRPGAFTKTLAERPDVRAYWNHNTDLVLGRTSNGTLLLRQDDHGLYFEVTPNGETTWGRDALAAAARQDVKGASFGFRIISAKTVVENGEDLMEITEVELREISPCTDPWYEATEIQARERELNAETQSRGDAEGTDNNETTADEACAPGPATHADESVGRLQVKKREIDVMAMAGEKLTAP
jgi:HK97 family phage prohead protease